MATSFEKTYSVTVTFSKSDVSAITAADINSERLREEIAKGISQVSRRTMGIYNTHPGTVTEA